VTFTDDDAGDVIGVHFFNTSATWTAGSEVLFQNNFIQGGGRLITLYLAKAIPGLYMIENVLDCAQPFSASVNTNGPGVFTNNWVGGDASNVSAAGWFNPNNIYTLNQRLNNLEAPEGFTIPYAQGRTGRRRQRRMVKV
jgi:hypothetical protein